MELTWLDPEHPDRRDVAGAVAVLAAARAVDTPFRPAPTVSTFTAQLRHGWDGDAPVTAVARDARGRVTGVVEVWLPSWDNTHLGGVGVTVDPRARRQGLGRRLLAAGLERIRTAGRRLAIVETLDTPAGIGFATATGLRRVSAEVRRRQDLTALDWAGLDQAYKEADRHAAGYELVRIAGGTPEHLMSEVAEMTAAINDAPTDDMDVEDEVFPPERIRAFEAAMQAHGRRLYRIVARERASGVLAGHTMVGVDDERPWYGGQFDTSVVRAHRGHRLGLLLKIAMLYWLGEEEPQLRFLDTSNAASNSHMIRVNELLGYEVLATVLDWQREV